MITRFAIRMRLILSAVLLFAAIAAAKDQPTTNQATSPEQHLGHPVGADFKLVDWNQCTSYYRKLAEQSPSVKLSVEGKTQEGRDFLLAVISSESNLSNIERLKAHAKTIADPRGKSADERETAIREGKVFLSITPAMHAIEVGGTQFGMQFAYDLATSDAEPWKSARENAVILLTPSLNPDGLDHVVEWYRRTVNTPYESPSLLKLYQFYAGHDNNRDHFMLTLAETKILSRLMYHEWRPQIHWDVHQQGGAGERMFVPPFRDPLNPNLDPAIVAGVNLIGTRAVLDLTREGKSGVACGVTYENWSGTGNRGIPARHNMFAILTELTSANIASPRLYKPDELRPVHGKQYGPSNQYVSPWRGGWWRIRDIIDYELAFGRSLLSTINREPQMWLRSVLEANTRAIEKGRGEGVRGWVIPSDDRDPHAVRRLIDALLRTGIEIHRSDGEITLDGRAYPAGSIVIRRDQPWATHVKDLFDIQQYPKGSEPYDVAGWTLPLLMGVRRVEVMQSLDDVVLKLVESTEDATAQFAGDGRVRGAGEGAFSSRDSSSWTELVKRLAAKRKLAFVAEGRDAGLFVPVADEPATRRSDRRMVSRLPRIGIYTPWSGNMDEGWLRWVFDSWNIPFVTVRNEQLRAGALHQFLDVLIIPAVSGDTLNEGRAHGTVHEQYTRGLAPEGTVAIQDFVRGGGTLITFAAASTWAIEQFELPLTDVTIAARSTTAPSEGFFCPGSILRSVPQDHYLTAGLPESLPMMFSSSAAWREKKTKEPKESKDEGEGVELDTLLRYAKTELLLSGFITKPETIVGHAAWVRARVDKGKVHLFAFQPHYRSWSHATFELIFRAALLDAQPLEKQ